MSDGRATRSFRSDGTSGDAGPTGEGSLPGYHGQLSSFHRAFERELQAIVDELPLRSGMRVLDLACGDGFYSRLIAGTLGTGGIVTGADINLAYISEGGEQASRRDGSARIELVAASFDRLPFPDDTFDLVWCAQSLHSLPDPVIDLAPIQWTPKLCRRGAWSAS